MESLEAGMCKSLIEWFKTLNLDAAHSCADELSDGVALAQALNQFAPESFTDIWLSKIKCDVSSNWRLKMSNIKKVVEGLYDYYTDVLNYSLSNFPRPDAMCIAEKSDIIEMERLLELVLGCAVNCKDKKKYISQIMGLGESLQQDIMKVLQELEFIWQSNSLSYNPMSVCNTDTKTLQQERDILEHKYLEARKIINLLMEEKSKLYHELSKKQIDFEEKETVSVIGDDLVSLGPMLGSVRYNELRQHMEHLKEELINSETSREDLKVKIRQQEKELNIMLKRVDELTKCAADFSKLKDEIDVLRESNDKLKVCEAQINTYKKKLEDYNILKKHAKILEERSAAYTHQNALHEENVKKCFTLKAQLEVLRKEVRDLKLKLDEEISNNTKLQFENKKLENTLHALKRTKETLCQERETLKETIDELKCGILNTSAKVSLGNTISKELQPILLTGKLQRLELENKALRERQGGQVSVTQLLDEANKHNDQLREQLLYVNERISCLAHVPVIGDQKLKREFGKQLQHIMESNEQKILQLDGSTTQIASFNRLSQLESTLSIRELELISYGVKYKKCLEKAREILRNIDPSLMSVKEEGADRGSVLKDTNNSSLNTPKPKMICTDFYRIGAPVQRTTDSRIAVLIGQGHTFLSRQRQSGPMKYFSPTKSN